MNGGETQVCDNCNDPFEFVRSLRERTISVFSKKTHEILRRYIGTSDIYCPYCQVKQ